MPGRIHFQGFFNVTLPASFTEVFAMGEVGNMLALKVFKQQ